MAKCKLCWQEFPTLTKHHLVPQHVTKMINKDNNEIKQLKIYVCEDCHNKIHDSFITHLIMSGTIKGFNKMDVINYQILRLFLMEKHPKTFIEYKIHKNELIKKLIKEMDEGDE